MRQRPLKGFTLVELLVVIAIIGILIALLLPAVQAAREAARRMQCSNNLKNLGLACHNYLTAFNTFPVSVTTKTTGTTPALPTGSSASGKGWMVSILPQIEQQALYDYFATRSASATADSGFDGNFSTASAGGGMGRNTTNAATKNATRTGVSTALDVFHCPSDSSVVKRTDQTAWGTIEVAVSNYKGVEGIDYLAGTTSSVHARSTQYTDWSATTPATTLADQQDTTSALGSFFPMSFLSPVRIGDFRDGTSNTIFIGEDVPEVNKSSSTYISSDDWCSTHGKINYYPPSTATYVAADVKTFRSRHPSGANFCIGDGSVTFISDSIDMKVYQYLATRGRGEVAQLPQ